MTQVSSIKVSVNYHLGVRWSTTSVLSCHLEGYLPSEMGGKACIVTLYVCWEHNHTKLSNTWYLYKKTCCAKSSLKWYLKFLKKTLLADAFVSCLPHSAATPSSVQEQNSLFFFLPNKKTNQVERETRTETLDLNCSASRRLTTNQNHVPVWKILATKKLLISAKRRFPKSI